MWEKTLTQRLLTIGVICIIALLLLVRIDFETGEVRLNLQPGQDIAGGVSLIFEIDEEGDEKNPQLAEQMKELLQKRVDPTGVYDLTWRVLGRNRLEVQMPLPPKNNEQLRAAYSAAEKALGEATLKRSTIERALRATGAEREEALARLAGEVGGRLDLLRTLVESWDAFVALDAPPDRQSTQPTSSIADLSIRKRDAVEAREDALDAVLATSFPMEQFRKVRDMDRNSTTRKADLERLAANYGHLADEIGNAITTWDSWRGEAAYLEGPADLMRLLRGAGVLEFRILAEPDPQNVTRYARYREQLEERGPLPQQGDTEHWFKLDNPVAFLGVDSPGDLEGVNPEEFERRGAPMVIGKRGGDWFVLAKTGAGNGLLVERGAGARKWKLKSAMIGRDQHGRRSVNFGFDAAGGRLFGELTSNNIEKQLCILIDDIAYSSANIQTTIRTSGQITGDFSAEKLYYLVQTMRAGVLPAKLKDTPLSERTIGSMLGEENLNSALRAGVAGVIAVGALMLFYYLASGAIANFALVMNILLVLAVMAMLGARFTLAGIAGVILTIGMTVDANVLIFERMREEKERGASLRMIIKNGYDKAFSTIIDANITTLLTCVIIYKVGSEEIKGFGLTLGWGIVTSLFTSLFVTRTLFTMLVKYGMIKEVRMLKLIGVPNVDWYGMRRIFIPISVILIAIGLGLLYTRGSDAFDVEFRGGVSAEVEVVKNASREYDDKVIGNLLHTVGNGITEDGRKLADAAVEPLADQPGSFRLRVADLSASRLAAMITEPLESGESGPLLERGGVDTTTDPSIVIVRVKETVTAEQLQQAVRDLADENGDSIPLAGGRIGDARIGLVVTDDTEDRGRFWNFTTTETNKNLVQLALVEAFGVDLQVQPKISFVFRGDAEGLALPITQARLDNTVVPVLPDSFVAEVTDYIGGAALLFDELDPPIAIETFRDRLSNMRLQPDFQDKLPYRAFDVYGVASAGQDVDGDALYRSVVVVVVDDKLRHDDAPALWREELASKEYELVAATLNTEQALRSVTQFKPQIASQAQTRALLALVLSWMMIIAYLWIRFGRPMYGIAGVVALVHDVCVALAFVGISGWIGGANHPIGNALLISDFKIDMTIVAAFLTIIGYSINDTIVIFDRIRETRGRLGIVTPEVINRSINQCLSRTLLTSITTLIVLGTMYIFGGTSIRGFNYCMIVGVVTGTYSSIAIAAPLLMVHAGAARTASGRARPATA